MNDKDLEKAVGGVAGETVHERYDRCDCYQNAENDKKREELRAHGITGVNFMKEYCSNCDHGYKATDTSELKYYCKLGK